MGGCLYVVIGYIVVLSVGLTIGGFAGGYLGNFIGLEGPGSLLGAILGAAGCCGWFKENMFG